VGQLVGLSYLVETHLKILRETVVEKKSADECGTEPMNRNTEEKAEYVFVDFNAWEYSKTDELWSGLIRGMYEKVEKRFEYEARRKGGTKTDFKRQWRIQRAVELMEEKYGGRTMLAVVVVLSTVSIAVMMVILLLSIDKVLVKIDPLDLGKSLPSFIQDLAKNEPENYIVSGILSIITFFWSNSIFQSAGVDRGAAIYEKAESVKDKIGLMATVREELTELFDFINKDFKNATGIQLRLVLFIDDLDRCMESKNVRMLEAIQLLLNVSGAPVFTFLMIDSRVVVASIEKVLKDSVCLEDAWHLAREYLEKIVQIPVFLPESSEERIHRYVQNLVKKHVTARSILDMISQLEAHHKKLQIDISLEDKDFVWWCRFPRVDFDTQSIGGKCIRADKFFESIDKSDVFSSLIKLMGKLNFGQTRNRSVFEVYGKKEAEEVLFQQAGRLLQGVEFFSTENENVPPDENVPQYQAPDGNVPQYQAPDGNVPQYQAPDGNVPQYQAPDGNDNRMPDGNGNVPPDGNVPQYQAEAEAEDAEEGEEEKTGQLQYVDDGIHLFNVIIFNVAVM
jgi:hypothetical protein